MLIKNILIKVYKWIYIFFEDVEQKWKSTSNSTKWCYFVTKSWSLINLKNNQN